MPTFRCSRCGRRFSVVEVPGPTLPCPDCGESVAAGRHARRAGAASTPPAPAGGKIALRKKCPECGTQYPVEKSSCPACGASYKAARIRREDPEVQGDSFAPERAGVRKGVVGGLVMIGIAVVWFFGGLAAGYVFYYPPILAIIGGYAVAKGLATGNLAGERAETSRRRRSG